mgnify:CR=1 FL=1
MIDSEKSVDDRANYKRCLHGRIVWEMKWEWIDGRILVVMVVERPCIKEQNNKRQEMHLRKISSRDKKQKRE